MDNDTSIREKVMSAIEKGDVRMRPRWRFLLTSALFLLGVCILLLTLLYIVSLGVFFMRESGAWFAPSFGGRGWFAFLRSLPWLLILLIFAFALVLETLVRRYSFVYKKPLLTSVLFVMGLVFAGGFAISLTPLHHQLAYQARHGALPEPFNGMYRPPFHMRSAEIYEGRILSTTTTGFVITDHGESTTTVVISRGTRLPYGADFTPGNVVVIIGDTSATDTIQAFGIRNISHEEMVDENR